MSGQGVLLATVETRKIFGSESTTAITVFYLLAVIAIVIFFVGASQRVLKYRRGRATGRPWWKRTAQPGRVRRVNAPPSLGQSVSDLALNRPIRRRKHAVGMAHLLVFWGFLGLLLATTIVGVQYDIFGHVVRWATGRNIYFFKGWFYLGFNAVFNAAGLALLVGLVVLMVRRARSKELELDYARVDRPKNSYSRGQFVAGDWLFVGLLAFLVVTGFLLQGERIDAQRFPSAEEWTWMGWLVAEAWHGAGVSAGDASAVHPYLWWVHSIAALSFVAYIPFSKAMHIVTSGASLVVADPSRTRQLPAPVESDHVGYLQLADFTWNELLNFDACTKCGRCHAACPARTGGAPLSPRDLVLDLRQWADRSRKLKSVLDRERRADSAGTLATGESVEVAGGVISERVLWSCTTCMACVEVCPVGIEHVPTIIQLRRRLVDQGRMEPMLQTALQNIAQQGNSFGKSSRMRARWTKGLDVAVKDARKEPVEHLWFVGDYASFYDRVQRLSRALARVLSAGGVDFGLLFEDERNAGNDVRRVGEEGLFEMLVEQNLAAFAKAEFRDVFTTDPHSYNTLRNEYPAYGFDKPVRHYSEVLADLVTSGGLPLTSLKQTVTYHDPCYLGRYNRITEAPRQVLAAIGCDLAEMPRNRTETFCCGAGGGRIWMDDSFLAERPSENRVKEAVALGVDTFVVACPKDYTMYSDAVKTTGNEGRLEVVDLVELVEAALAPEPALGQVAAP
ncbi:MAG: (Fe-S)-binding protein [Acidimicrobiales bacterium]